ncbi:MAG: hypothetical protein IKV59_01320 [Lachnospiraceae bacterium]|nr:hypothetical protein [Lachnospiraceae bacterium]
MKKSGVVLVTIFFVAGVIFAFFTGAYISDKNHMKDREKHFDQYMSFAIDTVENKGLSIDGASEAIASNIWVAHELCDNPEVSAKLSNIWNILVYEEDAFVGRESELVIQLKEIFDKGQ